jgi:hypothetical protein
MTASDTQASTPDESSWHPPVSDHDYAAADTAVLSPTARPPKRDRFGAPIGFAVALLLVVIGVAAYFGIHALIKPQPFSLTGTLQLNSDNLKTSGLPMGYTCAGQGGYDDIGPGTPVTVADDSGKLVAKGAIESSYSASGACMLTFKVFDVPGGAKFYKVQVSHRGEMSYTESEAKAGITVSLGDSASTTTTPPPSATAAPPAPAPAPPARPTPADQPPNGVPSYSTPCPSLFYNSEFPTSAVGSSVTSCAFAEQVRLQYLNQPRRNGPVVVYAYSPVTGRGYWMSCSGSGVVTCTGGDNAVIYLY